MAEQTAGDRFIECGRMCKPGHTLQWDQCQWAADPLGELGPAIRAAREVISEWETFTASDGVPSIRWKTERSSADIAREVVEVIGPLLAAIEPPQPDWSDLRDMARNAGFNHRKLAHEWLVWTNKDVYIELRRRHVGGWRVSLSGEFGDLSLTDPSPARVLNMARELGIGGVS